MAHFLPPEHVRQVNKLEWPYYVIHICHSRLLFLNLSVPWWSSARLALAVIGFFGFVNVYALRINLSVGMVCMVNHTAIKIQALNAAGAGGATYYNSSVNASSTGNFSVAAPEDVELCPAADSGGGPSIVSHFCSAENSLLSFGGQTVHPNE